MKVYIQKFIKSQEDLPKEGRYIVHPKQYKDQTFTDSYYFNEEDSPEVWLNSLDWYLCPVELSEEKISKWIDEYSMTKLNTDEEVNRFKKSVIKFYNWLLSKLTNNE